MSSPPSTPTAEVPRNPSSFRFVENGYPCEWSELYKPGGFHPTHFDDTFKQEQYRVLRKLGDGSFSTVWLVIDDHTAQNRALKIMKASSSVSISTELAIYHKLQESAPVNPLSRHVNMLLDTFEHTGPNGTHRCLVFEALGATAASMVDELPCNKPKLLTRQNRYPKAMAKIILKHALSGLAFLHENGIIHGDFQPGNLLFATRDLRSVCIEDLQQDKEKTTTNLQRLDGKVDRWAPRYLAFGQSLHAYFECGPDMTIKVSDLGAASWANTPTDTVVTPLALRAPELIFKEKLDTSIDIWSYGCLFYEFLTGSCLFTVSPMMSDNLDDEDDEHLLDLNDVLQPLPDSWLQKWPRANKWFGPNRERLDPYAVEGSNNAVINDSLEVRFEEEKPDDIDAKEAKEITAFIRRVLRYEPSQRPSAKDLLDDLWFQDWLER